MSNEDRLQLIIDIWDRLHAAEEIEHDQEAHND